MKDIKVNGKKLVLKKIPIKTMKKFMILVDQMDKIKDLEDNAENTLKVIEVLEKAQDILPSIYNLSKKDVEEFDINDITLAITAFQFLMQEEQEKQQETMKEYVENFSKN